MPIKLKNDREAKKIRCHFSVKAKRNLLIRWAHSILLFVEDSIGEHRPLCPEESKETSGFVAHDFRRKSSVLYLCEGGGVRAAGFCCAGRQSGKLPAALCLRSKRSIRRSLISSPKQRDITPRINHPKEEKRATPSRRPADEQTAAASLAASLR